MGMIGHGVAGAKHRIDAIGVRFRQHPFDEEGDLDVETFEKREQRGCVGRGTIVDREPDFFRARLEMRDHRPEPLLIRTESGVENETVRERENRDARER